MTSATTGLGTSHSWPLAGLINGDYNFYIRCTDSYGNINTDDFPINFTVSILNINPGGGGQMELPPIEGPKFGEIEDPAETEEEISAAEIEINHQYTLPSGGLCVNITPGLCLNVFGNNATVHNIAEIDPSKYKLLLCNQSYVYAYEINVTVDNAYLCFDKSQTDLNAISIYTFNGDWVPVGEIVEKDNQICGKITSSPYMIAGFKATPTQQRALDSITLAETRIEKSPSSDAQIFLDQARDAYFNCKYDEAYDLSQQALRNIPISLPYLPIWVWAVIAIVSVGAIYWYEKAKQKKSIPSETIPENNIKKVKKKRTRKKSKIS
jgi:hypothetical protein